MTLQGNSVSSGYAALTEILETYQYLGSLVADGSLSVPIEAT